VAAEAKRERGELTIRAFREADAAAVTEILRESPEASQWTEWGFKELLGWRGVLALVSEDDRTVTGFLIGREVAGEAEILNLAVLAAKRRRGEGAALLKVAMEELGARHVSRVFLEVRESNEAGTAFYEKHGFSKSGRRAGYYCDPVDAAIRMERRLSG
jgi:[ribosomal protein S18]-alanine N-acetyltransferase